MKRLLPFLFLLTTPATAQVVQPQYIRPSKGKALQIFNAPVNGPMTTVESVVYDWSAFSGVAFTLDRADNSTTCKRGLRVRVKGGPTTNKSDYKELAVINGYYNAQRDSAWFVSALTPYISVEFTDWNTGDVTECPGKVSVTMTPVPFDPTDLGASTTFEANVFDSGFADFPYYVQVTGVTPRLRLQNLGTTVVKCGVQPVNGSPISVWPIALSAGIAANDGKGGVAEINNFAARIICTNAVAGQTIRFSYFAH